MALSVRPRKEKPESNFKTTASVYGTAKFKHQRKYEISGYYRGPYTYMRGEKEITVSRHFVQTYVQTRTRTVRQSARYDIEGTPMQLKDSIALLMDKQHPPKERFTKVSAEDFLEDPDEYMNVEEEWVDDPEADS